MTATDTAAIGFPTEAKDPRFRAFFEYWRSKAPPGKLPGRQHIDPLEMKAFLPYVAIFDVERQAGGGYRFKHRLIGTHVGLLVPRAIPGTYVDEVADPEHYRLRFHPEMVRLVESHHPHYIERKTPVMDENYIRFCRLKLPLARDGENVDMVLCLYIGVRADGTLMDEL